MTEIMQVRNDGILWLIENCVGQAWTTTLHAKVSRTAHIISLISKSLTDGKFLQVFKVDPGHMTYESVCLGSHH